jgi:hypothetical protein
MLVSGALIATNHVSRLRLQILYKYMYMYMYVAMLLETTISIYMYPGGKDRERANIRQNPAENARLLLVSYRAITVR